MLEWLQSIGNFISIMIDFLVSFFTNVVEVVLLVFKGFAYVNTVILYLPVQYQVVILAFVSYCVIVTIIHFGG